MSGPHNSTLGSGEGPLSRACKLGQLLAELDPAKLRTSVPLINQY
jgi:hypothetical protein